MRTVRLIKFAPHPALTAHFFHALQRPSLHGRVPSGRVRRPGHRDGLRRQRLEWLNGCVRREHTKRPMRPRRRDLC